MDGEKMVRSRMHRLKVLVRSGMNRHHPTRRDLRGRGYFNRIGPGLVTGAADDDPSGIGTYAQIGAATGFGMLWSAPLLLPLAIAVQESCARLALANRAGLARIMKRNFPKPVVFAAVSLIVIANTVNIAADIASMAAAIQLLVPLPQLIGVVLLSIGIGATEILVPYHRYRNGLRWLCVSLLAYVAVLFAIEVPWSAVWRSVAMPEISLDRTTLAAFIALAGTTISPYLFVWQAAEEFEEMKFGVADISTRHITSMRVDVALGMLSGVVIMFSIMVTTGITLHPNGITSISTAEEAASALTPLAGDSAGLLFALGILGTGLLAVPVLAGASAYAVAELLEWPEGLERKPRQATAFYGVIATSMAVGVALNFVGIDPMHALFIAAVTNGLAAPILLLLIGILNARASVMGELKSGYLSSGMVFLTMIIMLAAPIAWMLT